MVKNGLLLFLLLVLARGAFAESGRLLYVLNCMGCHPVAEDDGTGFHSAGYRAQFTQAPKKRGFFIRLPAADTALSPQENRELVAEVLSWARACPQLPPGSALTHYQGPAKNEEKKR
jgi:hypothetical protein